MNKFIILTVIAFLGSPSLAADDFNPEEAAEVCSSCHGETGLPEDPEIPIIFGQEFFYIYTQLKDYSASRRQNETMESMVDDYSKSQLKEIALYLSEKTWPAIQTETIAGDDLLAERSITGGQCSACHGKWQGDSRIPRLAGQQPAYLEQTMNDFKHGVRMNAPDKNSTMKQIEDDAISALSRYLSAL